MNPVLTFEPDGLGHYLHADAIPLQSLGTLEAQRDTIIEFNSAVQQWEAMANDGAILFVDPSRSCCLAWELDRFNL